MAVRSPELTAPAVAGPRGAAATVLRERLAGGRLYLVLGGLALVIAALSLLIPSTPSYDPWAWLVWGKEIVHLDLHTTGGPTWKPLPVVFTTLFAPFGKAAPDMWLVVARAGALMAAAMVFKLTMRLTSWLGARAAVSATAGERLQAWTTPVIAAVIATIGIVFSSGFISDNALGYSEGLMAALVLIAIDRHLDGHRRQAFAVGFAAALDRPELWLFWGPYGLYLWWKDPGARRLVIGCFALIPVLWFLPELWGSGQLFRGASRAQHPRSNSPAFASCPFCKEFRNAWQLVLLRVKVVAGIGILAGGFALWRAQRLRSGWALECERERAKLMVIVIGLAGLVWWVLVAVLTQAGFSGNNRYLVLGSALIDIAGGVAWGWGALALGTWLSRAVGQRGGPLRALAHHSTSAMAVVALVVFLVLSPDLVTADRGLAQRTHRALVYQGLLRKDVAAAVHKLGGPAKVLRCGTVMTEGFQVPLVAWTLGVRTLRIEPAPLKGTPLPAAPDVILQVRAQHHASLLPRVGDWPSIHYRLVARTRTFRVFSSCAGRLGA